MHSKYIGQLALTSLLLTCLWVICMIFQVKQVGSITTPEQAVAVAQTISPLFFLTYLNTLILTCVVTALYSMLFFYFKGLLKNWSWIGLGFTPLYGLLNGIAYGSQITYLPYLVGTEKSVLVIANWVQLYPQSIISLINTLAYALLGIPSLIYAWGFWRLQQKWIALLIGGNGIACILGFIGVMTQSANLSLGVMVGGILFLAALFPVTFFFLKQPQFPTVKWTV